MVRPFTSIKKRLFLACATSSDYKIMVFSSPCKTDVMAEMGGLCASGPLWYYALTHGCLSSNVNADLNIFILFAFLPAIDIDKLTIRVLAVKLYQVSRMVNVRIEDGEQVCTRALC